MKLKRIAAFLVGLIFASSVFAQGIPNFLPANTVVGRLASNPGPTAAIPFATLAAQLGVGSTYLVATSISGTNSISGVTAGAPVLATNQTVIFIPANTNTGSTTFNRDTTGAINVFYNGVATVGGELQAGVPAMLFYDGTQYNVAWNGLAAGNAQTRGSVVAASTVNLDTGTSLYQQITGTTTITAFTIANGHCRFVEFASALTLTNGASLALPGAANIVTATGDTATVCGEAAGVVRVVNFSRAAGFGQIANSLSGDVALNNTGTFFDGPSIAQGTTGTWCAFGTVSVLVTAGDSLVAKLWDGTTTVSAALTGASATGGMSISLSGCLASPAGNLRISVKDATNTTGNIKFNSSGTSKDSTITAIRIQ